MGDVLQSVSPPFCGVWHAAGLLADGLLRSQNVESIKRVFAPKAVGAWALHLFCAPFSLQTFVSFSSVMAILGGAGQANYSAANCCLDTLSSQRRVCGLATSSVQWGPWADVGMAAGIAVHARLQASGMGLLDASKTGSAFLAALCCRGPSTFCWTVFDWPTFFQAQARAPVYLRAFAPVRKVATTPSPANLHSGPAANKLSLAAVMTTIETTAGCCINADEPLMQFGIDSLGAVEIGNQLHIRSGLHLPSTLVFDFPTARLIHDHLCTLAKPPVGSSVHGPQLQPLSLPSDGKRGSIWVCLQGPCLMLPNGVDIGTMASLSASAATVTSKVPPDRWSLDFVRTMPSPIGDRVMYGGFIRNAELFDNVFFGVSPAEAVAMDPQQRLLLDCSYAALHGASLNKTGVSGSTTGVFVGIEGHDWLEIIRASAFMEKSVYAATGSSHAIASGRLSFILGMQGPCVSIDTACSAALVANHCAMRALHLDECSVAVMAAVSLMLLPANSISFAIAGMTSATGASKTFDARADGYCRGEACCAVVHRACCDSDNRVVTLSGSCVRQDGKSASLTAPNGQAQQQLMRAALAISGHTASDILYLEAHGTGTALGDPIEAGSVNASIGGLRSSQSAMPVGSVKANAGHPEPAAGASGLMRLIGSLSDVLAAPNAHLRILNVHIGAAIDASKVTLSVQVTPLGTHGAWDAWRSGGVNSFGYSGTIVHAVVKAKTRTLHTPTKVKYARRRYTWRDDAHPFAKRDASVLSKSQPARRYYLATPSAMWPVIAEHIVHDNVTFPGSGYLEMARACLCEFSCASATTALCRTYFLRPLVLEANTDALLRCVIEEGASQFEITSLTAMSGEDPTVHAAGEFESAARPALLPHLARTRCIGVSGVDVGSFYNAFKSGACGVAVAGVRSVDVDATETCESRGHSRTSSGP